MMVQLLTQYTNPGRHNVQRYKWTDGQTNDIMMPSRPILSAARWAKTDGKKISAFPQSSAIK